MARANAFELGRELGEVERPVDRDEWSVSPSTGDCFYRWSVNDITVPVGMLAPPLFGTSMTRAMQFGALGTYLGHEVTHAFDDQGRKFDAEGPKPRLVVTADREKLRRASRVRPGAVRRGDGARRRSRQRQADAR
jgi:putative endopeptidase